MPMFGADLPSESSDHLVVRPAALGRLEHLRRELQVLVPPGGVKVIMFQEHGRRQDDIGVARGVGHELLVNASEQVIARKPAAYFLLVRSDSQRIGVLDQHCSHRRAAFQRLRVASQHRADARLVQSTNARIADIQTLNHRLSKLVNAAIAVEGAPSLMRPGADDGGNTQSRMHVRRAVTLAREAIAKAEEGSFRPPHQRGEFLDLGGADPVIALAHAGPRLRKCSSSS